MNPPAPSVNNDQGEAYGSSEQPPSIGGVRPIIISTPSGGAYSDAQPPSLNDVNKRDGSLIGSSSFTGNQGSLPPPPGMSLTGRNFTHYYPEAFQKDK